MATVLSQLLLHFLACDILAEPSRRAQRRATVKLQLALSRAEISASPASFCRRLRNFRSQMAQLSDNCRQATMADLQQEQRSTLLYHSLR